MMITRAEHHTVIASFLVGTIAVLGLGVAAPSFMRHRPPAMARACEPAPVADEMPEPQPAEVAPPLDLGPRPKPHVRRSPKPGPTPVRPHICVDSKDPLGCMDILF